MNITEIEITDGLTVEEMREELAALDERQLELVEREGSIGFSRRFGGLNQQSIRAKRARIQERQIALRTAIAEIEREAA
jgi:hypothetical protein